MQVHPERHVRLAAGLTNQQCPDTYSTSFTRARPSRSFLFTRTALPVQDQSHKPDLCLAARFPCESTSESGDWCVSGPVMAHPVFSNRWKMPTKGLFSETQLEKGEKVWEKKKLRPTSVFRRDSSSLDSVSSSEGVSSTF